MLPSINANLVFISVGLVKGCLDHNSLTLPFPLSGDIYGPCRLHATVKSKSLMSIPNLVTMQNTAEKPPQAARPNFAAPKLLAKL